MATTLVPMEKPQPDSDDEDNDQDHDETAWHSGEHIIPCPRSFRRGSDGLADHPPSPYTHLNDLEIVAMTLYHEIFHIVDLENDDQKRRGPRLADDGRPEEE